MNEQDKIRIYRLYTSGVDLQVIANAFGIMPKQVFEIAKQAGKEQWLNRANEFLDNV
jgi:transposase-like protein